MTALLRIERLVVEARTPAGQWQSIVRGVSLDVHLGEVVALIGESGAGKTTVALGALGYSRPGTRFAEGRVLLGGEDVLAMPPRERRKLRGKEVAYVAQSAQAALNPAIGIGEQVGEGLLLHKMADSPSARKRAIELMRMLDLPSPSELSMRYPHQASGGQQQRIMLAMALACTPKLLVLDEPTTALDVTTQIEVLKAISDIVRIHHTAAIYVSHDLAVVAQIADRILVMNDGEVVEEGATDAILHTPREVYTRRLLSAVRPKPTAEHLAGTTTPSNDERPLMAIRGVSASYTRTRWWRKPALTDQVLHRIEIGLNAREVLALVGESGSGKSTLARVISGLHPALEGEIIYHGDSLARALRKRSFEDLRRIQIVFQSPDLALNPERRVADALGRPLKLYFGMSRAAREQRIEELLAMVGLPGEFAGRYPSELSGGERQRASLARAFAARPDIILCDEVLSSLDTIVAASVLELMRELRERHHVAYLFISHDLATVATIADRVVVLYAGRVCDVGLTRDVFAPPHHPYTQLLISSVPALRREWLKEVLETREAVVGMRSTQVPVDIGCPFRTRCPMAIDSVCDRRPPPARITPNGQAIHCHREIDELTEAQTAR